MIHKKGLEGEEALKEVIPLKEKIEKAMSQCKQDTPNEDIRVEFLRCWLSGTLLPLAFESLIDSLKSVLPS